MIIDEKKSMWRQHIVASELKDPICHSNECQIGSFSSEATIYATENKLSINKSTLNTVLGFKNVKTHTDHLVRLDVHIL